MLRVLCAALALLHRVAALALGSARFQQFAAFCTDQQQAIIAQLEEEDGRAVFAQDKWQRDTGYGVTGVLAKGALIEKGAVSTTITRGKLSLERAQAISSRKSWNAAELVDSVYHAAALSIVLHSESPMVPTFRADVRYFELEDGRGWFGGGGDLTPYYLFDEDARHFHGVYKAACDKFNPHLYHTCKVWCDKYFYIPARLEHRGVGGIFFDDLSSVSDLESSSTDEIERAMAFTHDVCASFMPSYLPIVRKRRHVAYSEAQRHWQLLRRGRYIEFNMLYDRGVRFGLVPGGRIEAVMVSCPPLVAWDYNHVPSAGSEEERLTAILRSPVSWVT